MKLSRSAAALVRGYSKAYKDYDKMRGWKRALTLYCTNREKETGTPSARFRTAIKIQLAKSGFDTSDI